MDQDPVEGARLAITTQCCLSVWGTTKEDKKVLKVKFLFEKKKSTF